VDDRGAGAETVVLLHGGMAHSGLLLDAFGDALTARYRVVSFDRRGLGRTADPGAPFHYAEMATETIGVLESVVGGPAHLVGWSDGGIVAVDRPAYGASSRAPSALSASCAAWNACRPAGVPQ